MFTFVFILTSDNDCVLNIGQVSKSPTANLVGGFQPPDKIGGGPIASKAYKETNKKILFQEGSLVLFPDDIDYMYDIIFKKDCINYIITGQLVEIISSK
jgi:hypothetical protein